MSVHNRVVEWADPTDIQRGDVEPATRENGDALVADVDLWLDTSTAPPEWKLWDGAAWVSVGAGGGGSFDPDSPLDYFTMRDDAGDSWRVTMGTDGAFVTFLSGASLLTEAGDTLTTEGSDVLVTE